MAPNGDVAVSWVGSSTALQTAVLPAGGSWSAVDTFSATCSSSANPSDMAFTPTSTLVLVYAQCEGGDASTWRILARTRQAGGSFSGITAMSGSAGKGPNVAATKDGDVVVTWTRTVFPGPDQSLAGNVFRAGVGWGGETGLNGTVVAISGAPVALPSGAVLYPQLTGPDFSSMYAGVQTWLPDGTGWQVADQVGVGYAGSVPQRRPGRPRQRRRHLAVPGA